jgi:hypothetical protein
MALYIVGTVKPNDSTHQKRLGVWKSTAADPTTLTNWSVQDSWINFPEEIISLWSILDGTTIHIVTQHQDGIVRYSEFATSTDTWTTEGEVAANQSAAAADSNLGCGIAVRSDGDLIVGFMGYDGTYEGAYYTREEGAGWQAPVEVMVDAANHSAPVVILGSSDRTHFLYQNLTTNNVEQRALDSTNSLKTEGTVDTSGSAAYKHLSKANTISSVVRVPYNDSTPDAMSARFTSADTPTYNNDTVDTEEFKYAAGELLANMVEFGSDPYCIGVKNADGDIWAWKEDGAGTWAEEDEIITHAGSASQISAESYTRSGTEYIGFIYLDPGGLNKYYEWRPGPTISLEAVSLYTRPAIGQAYPGFQRPVSVVIPGQTAWHTPGTIINAARAGSNNGWSYLTGSLSQEDAVYATCQLAASTYSDWMRCTNYNFTSADIPAGSNILGIEVAFVGYSQELTQEDSALYLRKSTGQVGDNKASVTNWPNTPGSQWFRPESGASTDDWNAGLTQADIIASTFGVDYSRYNDDIAAESVNLDTIRIRIWYDDTQVINMGAATLNSYTPHVSPVTNKVTAWHPPTSVDQLGDGDSDWDITGAWFEADDDRYSRSGDVLDTGEQMDTLRFRGFDFTSGDIPDGATLDGIEFSQKVYTDVADNAETDRVYIYNNVTGTTVGTNQASGETWSAPRSARARQVFGGPTDLWDASPTLAFVRSEDFGIDMQAIAQTGATGSIIYIDSVMVRIHYTESVAPTVPLGAITLTASAQALDVVVDQTISMGAATLTASPQALTATADITISMQTADGHAFMLIGSPVNIVPGGAGMTSWHPSSNIYEGGTGWSNESNAELEDGNAASATMAGFGSAQNLFFETHNFTTDDIPSGAIVVGVEVDTKRAADTAGVVYEGTVRLLKGGAGTGDFKDNFDWWALFGAGVAGERHSWRTTVLGGPTDDWNAGLLDSDVRAAGFGFRFQALNNDPGSVDIEVDFHVIRVFWTLAQTVSMGTATLASSAQALTVSLTTTVQMGAATLVSSAQALTPLADQTISMGAATLASSAQALDVITDQTVSMGTATLASSAQARDVIPGAVTVPLNAITLASSPQNLDVDVDVIASMSAATLASAAQTLDVIPGAVAVALNAATLASSPQPLNTVAIDQTVSMGAATLVASPQALTVSVGATTISLGAITLASSAQALTVEVDQIVSMSAATLVSAAQALDVIPGAVTVPLNAITLASSAQALSVEVAQTVSLTAATLASSAQSLTVIPGAVSIPMAATTLASSAQALQVETDKTVALTAITLAGSAQALAVVAEGAPQTIALGAVTLASSAEALNTVAVDEIIALGAITLVSNAEALSVDAPITIAMGAITLASSAQTLNVDAPITIAMGAVTLTASPQALTVIAAGAAQTIDLGAVTLVSSAQALDVEVDQIVALGAITLASSAEALAVVAGAVAAQLGAVTLASSTQALTVETTVTIPLGAITLASSAQSLAVDAAGAPITISLSAITLTASPQTLNVAVDQTIAFSAITLTSSVQALTVTAVTVIPMGAVTLASSPQALVIIPGATSVQLSVITLVASPQNLAVDVGAAIVPLGSITLVSSAQAAAILIGAATVRLGAVTLTASPQALTVIPGATSVSLGAVTLIATIATLTAWPDGIILYTEIIRRQSFLTLIVERDSVIADAVDRTSRINTPIELTSIMDLELVEG